MDLLEYQGKQLFARAGVPVPDGEPARDVPSAVAAADRIGYPCVIKAQVQIGGRGKAGGIKIAADRAEAEAHAGAILGMEIRGPRGEGPFRVERVWVEAGSEIAANSGRWVKLSEESAQAMKKYGLRESSKSGLSTGVLKGDKGQIKGFVESAAPAQR